MRKLEGGTVTYMFLFHIECMSARKEEAMKDVKKIKQRGLCNKAELERVLHLTRTQVNKLWKLYMERYEPLEVDDTRIPLDVAKELLKSKERITR